MKRAEARCKLTLAPLCISSVAAALQAVALPVTPADLRAHVEFLASDMLEGRATPSRGLDLAAEYIAVQFRRAGLAVSFQQGDKPDVRNVAGILIGSTIPDQYVLVTAHYDHLGTNEKGEGEGDRINNGANDNASGVASMIEIARALAESKVGPKRTIVFIAFYGEELGLFGSRYYAAHPLVPIDATVAQINLEQTGRSDDLELPGKALLSLTGYSYSQVTPILRAAAAPWGVRFVERRKWTDAAFERSDNEALAKAGVPAHTVASAFTFADYHLPSDESARLDYGNMAKVTAAIAAGVSAIANRTEPPHWYLGAPFGQKGSSTPLASPVTRPAVPPKASAPKSERLPANPKVRPPKPSPEQ